MAKTEINIYDMQFSYLYDQWSDLWSDGELKTWIRPKSIVCGENVCLCLRRSFIIHWCDYSLYYMKTLATVRNELCRSKLKCSQSTKKCIERNMLREQQT